MLVPVYIVATPGFSGTLTPPVLEESKSQDRLSRIVQRYVFTHNMTEAEQLEKQIIEYPKATLPRIKATLQRGRSYSKELVGQQPGRVIHVRGQEAYYGLFVPSSYNPSRAYPLVVCLHGYGFTGDSYLDRWQKRLGENYLLACPTYMESAWWNRFGEELVLATLHDVQARYHVDRNRIFITGMSNGGIGTWIIGMHHADVFAGIAPMASGIDEALYPFLANLRQTPVYVIHGVLDQIMPVGLSRRLVREMAERQIPHVYREHTQSHSHAGGHFFPREELPELVAWFDRQQRVPSFRHVDVVRDATHLTRFSWTRIDATDRIAAFSENLVDSRDEFITRQVYATLEAELVAPNHVVVQTTFVRRYSLFFNQNLIDFSQPLIVETNGIQSFHGLVVPDRKTLLHEARLRKDPGRLFSAQVTIDVEPTSPE